MIFKKEKTRIISFLLFFFVCIFTLSNCNNSKNPQTDIQASQIIQSGISRQSFYTTLYNEIATDELLRSAYFAEITEQSPEDLLNGNFLTTEKHDTSYESLIHQAKKDNLSNLSILTRNYSQGSNDPKAIWLWGKNNSSYSPWDSLIEDFDEIADESKTAVVFFCNTGLAKLNENQSNYTLSFKPNEKIPEAEALQLQQSIKAKMRKDSTNSIPTTDHEGNEILLCFSDPTTLFMFKNLTEYLSEREEIISSFVFFDEKGTELSLWINSVSGGMFSIPLNIGQGAVCVLPCYSNKTFLKQRLDIVNSLLPKGERQKANADFEALLNSEIYEKNFSYSLNEKTRADITVSFSREEYSGTVYFKTTKC
ncbi:MAG: hypothetical protein E7387_07535 [Ruminococcaceae bacterium]|nr:hypothetical protein [Oscillospiraceae bacterium]